MKKIFLLASAGLLMASCSDDLSFKTNVDVAKGNTTIIAKAIAPENIEPETRTEWTWSYASNGNASAAYNWSVGDVIGAFPVDSEGNLYTNLNAFFRFLGTTPSPTGTFTGDFPLVGTGDVYAYYPYDQKKEIYNGEINGGSEAVNYITLEITQNQNFNYTAAAAGTITTTEDNLVTSGNGSFSQEMAPSVGYGTINAGDEEVEITFKNIGFYVGVPVIGLTPTPETYIKTLTMTITDGSTSTPQPLYGTINVPLTEEIATSSFTAPGLDSEQSGLENQTRLVLNCGVTGVDLSQTDVTWFWFVIPAGVTLRNEEGVTFDFYVNNTGSSLPEKSDFYYTFKNGEGQSDVVTTSNNMVRVVNTANPEPFVYNPLGYYMIEDENNFLEYASLVTNGTTALSDWQSFYKNTTAYEKYGSFSQLPSMLTYNGEEVTAEQLSSESSLTFGEGNYAVRPALVNAELDFGAEFLAQNKEEIGTLGTGGFADPALTYLYDVFGGYQSEGVSPIGGGANYSFYSSEGVTVSNLPINGDGKNGVFTYGEESTANVVSLSLVNPVIYNCSSFVLAPAQTGTYNTGIFADVTGAKLYEGATNETTQNMDAALFENVNASGYKAPENFNATTAGVKYYATNFVINDATYSFASTFNYGYFEDIYIQYETSAPVLTVPATTSTPNANVETVINMVKMYASNNEKEYSATNPYSVVAGEGTSMTSYYTGIPYQGTAGYAENLAYLQTQTAIENFNVQMNLDLGSEYATPMVWPIRNTANRLSVTGSTSTTYTIGNALITGEEGSGNNYSLFGENAQVTNVNIGNVTIQNYYGEEEPNTEALIAILATHPSGSTTTPYVTNNVEVTGTITIIVKGDYTTPIGGFFQNLNGSAYLNNFGSNNTYATTASYDFGNNVAGALSYDDLIFGYNAGEGMIKANPVGEASTTNMFELPGVGENAPFAGKYPSIGTPSSIVITATPSNATDVYLTIPSSYANLAPKSLDFTGTTITGNLPINVTYGTQPGQIDGEQAYYQYLYSDSDSEYYYYGIVVPNTTTTNNGASVMRLVSK